MLIRILKYLKKIIEKYNFYYIKTIIVNMRLLPIRQALKFPIVIYSPCELLIRRSQIILEDETKIKFGMIALGRNDDKMISSKTPLLLMLLDSKIFVNGNFRMSSGCTLRMDHGKLYLGKGVAFGGGCKLFCNSIISIGDYTQFAFNCVCTDTDFHYIYHKGLVKDCLSPISIGDRVWIGNNSTVSKGTVLASSTILASRSYANKNYMSSGEGALLVGSPAICKRTNCYRIHDSVIEASIRHFFEENKGIYIMTPSEFESSQLINR